MNKERAKELLETELKCITRVDACNRDCGKCDLVQNKGYVQMGNKKINHVQRDSRKTRKEVTMTNRGYLKTLSNDKLAELLNGFKIFDLDCIVCEGGKCTKCITKWLDTERMPSVEKGQIREADSCKWLVITINESHDNCLMLSETGVIRDIPTDAVEMWKIVTDETAEMFYNRVFNEFKKATNKVFNELKKENDEI